MSMISFRRRAARLKSEARKREKEQHNIRETPEQKKVTAKAAPKAAVAPTPTVEFFKKERRSIKSPPEL